MTVYEIGEVEGRDYISTKLIDGQTLRQHLAQKEALPLNTILKIGAQVAEALSAAHHWYDQLDLTKRLNHSHSI